MEEIALRPATEADYGFWAELHRQTFAAYVAQAWGWDEARLEAEFRQEFGEMVRQVVEWGEEAIGSIVVEDHGDHFYLDYIAILPAYQGRGIGSLLVKRLLQSARQPGIPVRLSVLKVNPARALYERLGFVLVGEDQYRNFLEAQPSSIVNQT
jgi:ribosomal protein S18 acetylase RimI-like enzyme